MPFMPTLMPKIWDQIGATEADVTYEVLNQWGVLPPQTTVRKGEILFPKTDIER